MEIKNISEMTNEEKQMILNRKPGRPRTKPIPDENAEKKPRGRPTGSKYANNEERQKANTERRRLARANPDVRLRETMNRYMRNEEKKNDKIL
jgi:hypothetical protein